jgi:hypothetical protein
MQKHKMRKKAIINWIAYINKNYDDTLPIYFNLWIYFTKVMGNRSKLLTTTDANIYITDKIFNNIKTIQKNKLQ